MGTLKSIESATVDLLTDEKRGMHYFGFVLLLCWYYCLWFVPDTINVKVLTDDAITFSWIPTLVLSGVCLVALPVAIGHNRRLSNCTWLRPVAGIVLSAASLAFSVVPFLWEHVAIVYVVIPTVFGLCNAVLWVLWGEFFALKRVRFSFHKIAPLYAFTMTATMVTTYLTPNIVSSVLVAAMPLASALLLRHESLKLPEKSAFPTLLPEDPRSKAMRAIVIISLAVFVGCAGCYYNVGIIPLDSLPADGSGYTLGVVCSALALVPLSFYYQKVAKNSTVYNSLPYLFLGCIISLAMYASQYEALYFASFEITVMVVGVFEVVLIAYFGTLSSKGYIYPAMAFGMSSGFIKLGFAMGDINAVVLEQTGTVEVYSIGFTLMYIALLAMVLIALLRQEHAITDLTVSKEPTYEIDEICDGAISQFGLSAREGEILKLIAKGYTVDSISKKLVISPYTTQTHVRHIYAKMQIHKRSELLDYINMHRTE